MSPLGTIITFYSYKGGTGRSMALANVAWILASAGKSVLVIDWDLEAPGLHRYFRPFLIDKELTSSEGLIDFVTDFADEVVTPSSGALKEDWYIPYADITRYALSINFDGFPEGGKIDFIPAGHQGTTYATRVNSFNWQSFYERLGGGALFEAAKDHIRKRYQYILIDSRTGVSDTAGICTVQMPDKLAVCFTYNNQSIEGASGVARSTIKSRQGANGSSRGAAGLEVFPIPTRVDQSESERLRARQSYAWSVFDEFLAKIPESNRRKYWADVEVPYIAYFGYEEVLATFRDDPEDPKQMLSAFDRLTQYLTDSQVAHFKPLFASDVRDRVLLEFARTPQGPIASSATPVDARTTVPDARELVRLADAYIMLLASEQQVQARRILTRLVRVDKTPTEGTYAKLRTRLAELGPLIDLARKLGDAGILVISGPEGAEDVELANESLIQEWSRLREWIESDLEFLFWRQRLRDSMQDWEANNRKADLLFEGGLLRQAQKQKWLEERVGDLNAAEREFVSQSVAQAPGFQAPISGGSRAFIIRPFGIKSEIDFDRVERELVGPALDAVGYTGRTTGEILSQGNIRTDMFQRLLIADLVVADLSIHHSNVFYELGIRHALREKRTFLLRSEAANYPFDLQADRYFVYDKNDPAASLPLLVRALEHAKASSDADSPVFRSLPNMRPQDPSKFLAVPIGFVEEAETATDGRHLGDLELLAAEAKGFDWESEGLRLVGRAQFNLRAYEGARDTWEMIRSFDPDNLEANTLLATIYQRLGDLTRSDEAVKRALKRADMAGQDRAEVFSLKGRNAKSNWRSQWKDLPFERRREEALRSPYLEESLQAYTEGFNEALNHFYSGLNALGVLKVQIDLATALPDVWAEQFEAEAEAEAELAKYQERFKMLVAAVQTSINAAQSRLARERKTDLWVDISEADLYCLTSDRPKRVANAYRKALAGAPDFAADAARGQLELYQQLGVLPENVAAALREIPAASQLRPREERPRVLLFTGHMIDRPGREKPRFPPDKEDIARQAIRKAIKEEQVLGPVAYGIAGGASGGDILFHEVCAELGIPTRLYLVLPREEYIVESVQAAGPKWVERFNRLYDEKEKGMGLRVLSTSRDLPAWLAGRADDYSIWQRNNLWMLYNALAEQAKEVTLIALWDGKGQGDGPGGTSDLVQQAQHRGAKFVHLPTNELFGIHP